MLGIIAGILFLISGFFQPLSILENKSSKNISIMMYLTTFLGVLLNLIESFNPFNFSLVFSNSVSLVMMGITMFLIKKYR